MNGLGILVPFRACSASDAVRLGVEAEGLGYSAVWVPEVSTFDAISVVAALTSMTEKVNLGTAIVPLGSRSPVALAMSAITLADLAPGRVTLGLGVSSRIIVEDWHGREFGQPLVRVRDAMEIIRQTLAGESTDHTGTAFRSVGFKLDIVPKARPKIYLAAMGPVMRKAAEQLSDGLILNFMPRSKASFLVSQVSSPVRPFDWTSFVRVAISDSEGISERRIRREMASYLRIEQYRNWLFSLGLENFAPSLSGDLDSVASRLPSEFVDDVAIMGDVDTCREKLRELQQEGIDPIVVPSTAAGDLDSFRRLMVALA